MRYHFRPNRRTISRKTYNNKCWQGCRETGTLIQWWWECGMLQPPCKQSAVPQNVKHGVITWSRNSTPKYTPNGSKSICLYKNCTQMLIAALFIIAPKQKQYKFLPTDAWKHLDEYIHTMEYWAMKRKEVLTCATTQRRFENVM